MILVCCKNVSSLCDLNEFDLLMVIAHESPAPPHDQARFSLRNSNSSD